jgi:hypothetical protein
MSNLIMKKTIRAIFKLVHMGAIFCLCGMAILYLVALPCFGVAIGSTEPVVSITSTNEPLKNVLDEISKATGYKIEITKGWEHKPITVNIQDLPLDKSLRKVIRALGRQSNIIVTCENTRTIKIKIFDTTKGASSTTKNKNYAQLQAKQAEAVLNMEEPPTGQEQVSTDDSGSEIDPLDIEVIPPDYPGEKGITVRELKEFESNQEKIDPLDLEVLPPDNPGEKGITARELKAME